MVASILVAAMIISRKKGFRILSRPKQTRRLLEDPESCRSSDELLPHANGEDSYGSFSSNHAPKQRDCCGSPVFMPNSSRFANHFHSRVLQRFPFLMEMFYWVITYAFYRFTSIASQRVFSGTDI